MQAASRPPAPLSAPARGNDFPVSDDTVINLLTDLRHFCIARHINFTACNGIAEGRFNAEINGVAL